jgi:hypothetical protein
MASSLNYPSAEDVLDWAMTEMQYHPQERFAGDNLLDADAVRSVCRGNLAPMWKFLVERVSRLTVKQQKCVREQEVRYFFSCCGAFCDLLKPARNGRNLGELPEIHGSFLSEVSLSRETDDIRCVPRYHSAESLLVTEESTELWLEPVT